MRPGYLLATLLLLSVNVIAADAPRDDGAANDSDAMAISGMSIVGNSEAPKSLTIVPWKGSDVGAEIRLDSSLLEEGLRPVDREVFMREISYFEISNPK
jgi:hypothetical protein